jgi:hypothetical protein
MGLYFFYLSLQLFISKFNVGIKNKILVKSSNIFLTLTIRLSTAFGYDTTTLGFLAFLVVTSKFSGKDAGSTHQIPSVSNSKGRPTYEIFYNV